MFTFFRKDYYEAIDVSTTRDYTALNQKLSFVVPKELNEHIRNAKDNVNK